MHGSPETEIRLLFPFQPVYVLKLVMQGAGLVQRNLGIAKRSDGVPPVKTAGAEYAGE